ncbi:hypothetical protein ACFLRP_00325 [Bacteroidota bacterium]
MIDWNLVAKVAGGGFGVTVFVLLVLAMVAWIMGIVVQRTARPKESEQDSAKG